MAPDQAADDDETKARPSLHELAYDALPDKRRAWHGEPGSREEGLGRLVLLTPEVVAYAAQSCIKTGLRVSLNWDLNKLETANFNRSPTQHHIFSLLGGVAFDDLYIMNPQGSSQWDGLRHFSAPFPAADDGPPPQRLYYGGTTAAEICDRASDRIGIQHWARHGICGRGVLLDYVAYARRHGISYSPLARHAIPLPALRQMALEQGGLDFRRGDILFVRTGMTLEWETRLGWADKLAYSRDPDPRHAGLEGSEDVLRWLWDTGFAAVAGDAVAFEAYPPAPSWARPDGPDVPGLSLHERLLAGFGVPIGELFDLEELSRTCAELGRWHFFVTSSPLNMPGGVSSPPNCLAIF
ncbi:hypothetical protein CDD83_6508 [Cordyceps sp. RAO-2017]|nr:hypothetical protein CDD83_6508 [Cordyceps sp. RAO-2017]